MCCCDGRACWGRRGQGEWFSVPDKGIQRRRVNFMEAYEARRGTVVHVREDHWKSQFSGMLGTIEGCWGQPEHALVADVLLEDGSTELFWLPNLEVV